MYCVSLPRAQLRDLWRTFTVCLLTLQSANPQKQYPQGCCVLRGREETDWRISSHSDTAPAHWEPKQTSGDWRNLLNSSSTFHIRTWGYLKWALCSHVLTHPSSAFQRRNGKCNDGNGESSFFFGSFALTLGEWILTNTQCIFLLIIIF